MKTAWSSGVALLLACAPAVSHGAADWPDDGLARLEAAALLAGFESELLASNSATLTLEHWCATHRLAMPAQIVADRQPDAGTPLPSELASVLAVAPTDPVRHRRVRLRCGNRVLSEADNWYVPARLTADMNRRLDTTDEPFGKVVKPLGFSRRTLSAVDLWKPLPDQWEMSGTDVAAAKPASAAESSSRSAKPLRMPQDLWSLRAVLAKPDGVPFSVVIETYKSALLDFPQPRLPLIVE